MQRLDHGLITPIYLKTTDNMPMPDHPVFYLLAANSLYLCRNHRHYQSCSVAPNWPTELAPHTASLVPKFPTIPRELLESICGFFAHMSDSHGAESIVLLAWDAGAEEVRMIVPRQVAAVSRGRWGTAYPIGVKYQFPHGLPADWSVFCDIHSHCEMAAYASQTDIDDEFSFAGLHLVVGRLYQEPPQFHAEGVVDGTRFPIELDQVIEGYQRRARFPVEWLNQVIVTDYATFRDYDFDVDVDDQQAAPIARIEHAAPNDPVTRNSLVAHNEQHPKQQNASAPMLTDQTAPQTEIKQNDRK